MKIIVSSLSAAEAHAQLQSASQRSSDDRGDGWQDSLMVVLNGEKHPFASRAKKQCAFPPVGTIRTGSILRQVENKKECFCSLTTYIFTNAGVLCLDMRENGDTLGWDNPADLILSSRKRLQVEVESTIPQAVLDKLLCLNTGLLLSEKGGAVQLTKENARWWFKRAVTLTNSAFDKVRDLTVLLEYDTMNCTEGSLKLEVWKFTPLGELLEEFGFVSWAERDKREK